MSPGTDNDALSLMLGRRVEVRSNSGDDDHYDIGTLESYHEPWLRLRVGNDLLCFPIYNVRLVKLLERLPAEDQNGPKRTLLRPTAQE